MLKPCLSVNGIFYILSITSILIGCITNDIIPLIIGIVVFIISLIVSYYKKENERMPLINKEDVV